MGSKFFNFTGLELSLDANTVLSKPNGKPADMSAAVPATLKDGIVFVEVKNLADVIVLEVPENASIHMYVLHDAYTNLIYVGSNKKNVQTAAAMLESEKRWHQKYEYTVIARWSTPFWEAVQRRFAVKPEGFAAPKPDKPAKPVVHRDATAETETAVEVVIREQGKASAKRSIETRPGEGVIEEAEKALSRQQGKSLAERIAARAAEHAQEAPKEKAPATEEKPKVSAADFFKDRHRKS
ncbi:MAG: hypothetical protein Q4A96_00820 [Candidatus Saccharibacteria bacterium]|nr:hypothetical protein [Candidatus Saccharibacteria bacterium]